MMAVDTVSESEKLKNEANRFLQDKKYDEAIRTYSKAIELNSSVSAYYSNRALAYMKTECYGYALLDANKALELDPNFVKGYYRRATANMGMGHFRDALKDFRVVCKFAAQDADARRNLQECEKIVRRMEFEKAIASDEVQKLLVDTLPVDHIVVESQYDGPRLEEDGKMSADFIMKMIDYFKNQKMIHRKYAYQILKASYERFKAYQALIDVEFPKNGRFTVCGDVHGQYYDFLNIFEKNGYPSESNPYLFNGDFVDRGSFSLETILTMFSYKLLYPNHFHMVRGNHETDDMNRMYGFEGEVKAKQNETMYKMFQEVFCALPLCAVINQKVFVTHGGLFSRDNVTLDELRQINRFSQPKEGLMVELMWSDPQPSKGRMPSKRGTGLQFGPDVTENFLSTNSLDYMIRSHEMRDNGYTVDHDGKCITIFSAPNYCDSMNNKGAFINLNGNDLKPQFVTFDAVPHPQTCAMAYASPLVQ